MSPRDDPDPVVSVVIVTWNSRDATVRCLEGLRECPPSVPWEAFVIDNASTDGTPEAVREHAPWAHVIVNPTNRGLPAANNQGIIASTGRFILIANPDTQVRPGAVDALLSIMDRHPRAVFAIPRLLYDDGRLQTSVGELPSFWDVFGGRRFQQRRRGVDGYWWDGWAHDEERRVGRGYEACYLVRREAVEQIGLQDEGFFLDYEGPDWTIRARDLGWEVWFTPAAEVVHSTGVSITQVPYRWIVWSHKGMYRYFAKRRPRWQRPLLAAAFGARAATKAIAQAVTARTGNGVYRKVNPPRGRSSSG